jgi:hypothetical protein
MKLQTIARLAVAAMIVFFLAVATYADSVDVTLTQTSQIAAAGSTITFDATITNLSSTDAIFLNGDSSVTSSSLLTVDDTPFLANFPLSLDAGEVSGPFALFDVFIDPSTPTASYDFNSFSILGGLDGDASDIIGGANFSISVGSVIATPEPGTLVLLLSALLTIGVLARLSLKH